MRRFNFIAVIALIAGVSYAAIEPISSPPTTSPKMSVGTGGIASRGTVSITGASSYLTVQSSMTAPWARVERLGVGVNPAQAVEVNGNIHSISGGGIKALSGGSEAGPDMEMFNDGDFGFIRSSYYTGAYKPMKLQTGGLTTVLLGTDGSLTATASTTTLSRLDVGGKIGISSPTANSLLSIDGNPGGNPLVSVINSLNDSTKLLHIGTQNNYFDFWRDHTTGHLNIQGSQSGANSIVLAPTSGAVGIGTTNPGSLFTVSANTFTVASSGIVSAPSQPYVRAPVGTNLLQNGISNKLFFGAPAAGDNINGMWGGATSSGTFTAPADGIYHIAYNQYTGATGAGAWVVDIKKDNVSISGNYWAVPIGTFQGQSSTSIKLSAGSTIEVWVQQAGTEELVPNTNPLYSYFVMEKAW